VKQPHAYLAFFTTYQRPDDPDYLLEWIEFHRLVGGERFYIYDDPSVDHHRDVLAPYVEQGIVELHEWLMVPGLAAAMNDCIARHRDDARWIALLDLDEFLFSPTGGPVSEVLRDYEQWPGVAVNRLTFGPSGHRTKPPGLVIENYVRRAKENNKAVKSIVDPARTERGLGHHAIYRDGALAVDELMRPMDPEKDVAGARPGAGDRQTETFSVERLRINHYATKSEEEWLAKLDQPRPDSGEKRGPPDRSFYLQRLDAEQDDTIVRLLPALRRALGRD
jgi:Glycosyltransferase family 92